MSSPAATPAPLDPLSAWKPGYDRMLLSDVGTLAFAEAGHSVLLLGPVGVGKIHLARVPKEDP